MWAELPSQVRSSVIDAMLILVIVAFITGSLLFFKTDFTIAFTILVGAWFFDTFVKKVCGIENLTIFADLSFASFVYFASYTISLYSLNFISVSPITLNQSFIVTFLLLLLWLGNLSLSRVFKSSYVRDRQHSLTRHIMIGLSIFFGSISTFFALLPLIIEKM